jgi:uncharacterized damage-inducible protein DinB
MTVREFYLESRRNELPAFQRVLNALPQDKFHYKPHDRSPSAEQLVWTMTHEMQLCKDLIDKGELEFAPTPAPTPDQMVTMFPEIYQDLLHGVSKMSEADWQKIGKAKAGGQLRMEQPVGSMLWMFHHDAIHHRGQLSAYIRPMGGKVPSIYGPSGDDPGL